MNILTIDLENWYPSEYYQSTNLSDTPTLRHLQETLRLLRETGNHATFFILGELAERNPHILQEIYSQEHEIAYHSYHHTPLPNTPPHAFNEDLQKFLTLTSEQIHQTPKGFRAPLFSLQTSQAWIIRTLEEEGFNYDSSILPAWTLYGNPKAPTEPYHPSYTDPARKGDARLWELPLDTLRAGMFRIPIAGGFYTRILPESLTRLSLRIRNARGQTSIIYFHPRELDPDLTQVPLSLSQHFMLYFNIRKMRPLLERLLHEFRFETAGNLIQNLPTG